MMKQLMLGTAGVLLLSGTASALNMSVTTDDRRTYAEAAASGLFDSDGDAATAPLFDSQVNASAGQAFPVFLNGGGGGGGGQFGAYANASAGQLSSYDALSISASGHADASGFNDYIVATVTQFSDSDNGAGGGGGLPFGSFEAAAESVVDLFFSIDAAATFDLSGFLSAGLLEADGPFGSNGENAAGVSLVNTDTSDSVFGTMISNDFVQLDESGVIGPGNYRFTARAIAEVEGFSGDEDAVFPNGNGNATGASFNGVTLSLTAVDQPIPEPVTTTLAAMGIGALVLRTSRRRGA